MSSCLLSIFAILNALKLSFFAKSRNYYYFNIYISLHESCSEFLKNIPFMMTMPSFPDKGAYKIDFCFPCERQKQFHGQHKSHQNINFTSAAFPLLGSSPDHCLTYS